MATVVVVGGGIAGISCVEALFLEFDKSNPQFKRVVLISESRLVKKVKNYESIGRQIEKFDVSEVLISDLELTPPKGLEFSYYVGFVTCIDHVSKTLSYRPQRFRTSPAQISYDKLCVCIGSKPRRLNLTDVASNELKKRIIVIRDTSTVIDLNNRLKDCRKLVIVGDGGIGLELVFKVSNCEKVWVVRGEFVGQAFFDSGAAKFLLDTSRSKNFSGKDEEESRSEHYSAEDSKDRSAYGPSLGVNWTRNFELKGSHLSSRELDILYQDEVEDIIKLENQYYPLRVLTRNKRQIDCDLVATAIGVDPNELSVTEGQFEKSLLDGGILVDDQMRTSLKDIYAAGDIISCDKWKKSDLWFQMRLWTQARPMGHYAGRCISSHILKCDPSIYFNFDCFTHCTSFFGFRIVLLGRFNGQRLRKGDEADKFEVIARVNQDKDYVKLLIDHYGRIIGAVLVGESGLEETIENLILDRIDVSKFKDQLLDDTIDIDDYFD